MLVQWIRKSARLQEAEVEGRIFRIERTGNAHIGSGCVRVREVDGMLRDLNRATANGLREAKKIVKEWTENPRPETPLPIESMRILDTNLGLGRMYQ